MLDSFINVDSFFNLSRTTFSSFADTSCRVMTNHGRSDDVLLMLRAGDQAVEVAVKQTQEPTSMGLFALAIAAFS